MPKDFNQKQDLELNFNYDKGLMQTAYARILMSHLEQVYPRVQKKMSETSMIEYYIEPKIMKQLLLEQEYRDQGYPLNGVQELAFNDVTAAIKIELVPYEDEEYLNEFDLDIHPVIDTETIQK